jgi:hypothetical protein
MLRTAVRKGLASELTAPDAAACSRDRSVRIAAVLGDAIVAGSGAGWRQTKLPATESRCRTERSTMPRGGGPGGRH